MKPLTPMFALLVVLLSLDANAQPSAKPAGKKPAANPPACDGLKSTAGKFTDNLKNRKNMNKSCEGDKMKEAMARVRKALDVCKDVHGSKDQGINVDIFFPEIQARAEKACKVHDHVTKTTDALCTQYDVATAKSAEANQAFIDSGISAQTSTYARIAQMHAPLVKQYNLFSKSMTENDRVITKNMDGMHGNSDPGKNVKDDIDPVMSKAIEKLKYQINGLVKAKVDQTKANGNARVEVAGRQGDAGSIKFDNDDQVRKFSIAADACQRAAKQGGSLDQFNKAYQNNIAKSLALSQIESRDLAKKFEAQAKEHKDAQDGAEASGQHMARTEGNTDKVMADKANGLRGSSGAAANAQQSISNGARQMQRAGGDIDKAETIMKNLGATWDGKSVVSVDGQSYRVYHKPAAVFGEGNEYYIPVK